METPKNPEAEASDPFTPDCAENGSWTDDLNKYEIEGVLDDDDQSQSVSDDEIKKLFEKYESEAMGTIVPVKKLYDNVDETHNILSNIHSIEQEMDLINFLKLCKICKRIDPKTGKGSEISEDESMLITQIYRAIGYNDGWIANQFEKFHMLEDKETRRKDPMVQQYNKQFKALLMSFGDENLMKLISSIPYQKLEPCLKDRKDKDEIISEVIEIREEDMENPIEEQIGVEHWEFFKAVLPDYFIIHSDQLEDVIETPISKYERLNFRTLKRESWEVTEMIDRTHKKNFHFIYKDGKFQRGEEIVVVNFLGNRYGVKAKDWVGFKERIIDEMEVEDEVIWKTLNGYYENQQSMGLGKAAILYHVEDTIKYLTNIMEPFRTVRLGFEMVNCLAYTMDEIFGIRGRTNQLHLFKKCEIHIPSEYHHLLSHDSKTVKELSHK